MHNGNEIDELKKIFYEFLMKETDGETHNLNMPPKYLVRRAPEAEFILDGSYRGNQYSINRESVRYH